MPAAPHLLTRILDNGLTVVVAPDTTLPAVAVNLWYRVGSADETAGHFGFAHLFEHLMFSGTTSGITSGEHLATIESMGGVANATTSFDRTNYFETVPPGALELALWLEAERMAHLAVTEENLATQREVVKEEKRHRYDNTPYGDLLDALLTSQFDADEPYGHSPIGSVPDLDAATLDDVVAFHGRWYRPSNATLVLAGCLDAEEAMGLADRYLGKVPDHGAGPAPSSVPAAAAPRPSSGRHVRIERAVPRTSVVLAWPTPSVVDPASNASSQALAVLGDGMTSRLVRRLDRELGLVDAVSVSGLGLSRGTSLTMVIAQLRPGVEVDRFRAELDPVVRSLATRPPSAEELGRCRARAERDWLEEWATADSRADMLNFTQTILGDAHRVREDLERTIRLTADEVAAAAVRFDPGLASTVVHVDGSDAEEIS
ncbi:M16 family metallopeptidase [Acidipropionibacterium timonense]|uniref:M16 family metallopeptidase n=1 Tax=Acidipropionibacterium timonense TaxID=2161818 RepID=UPI00103261E4|nr:pitrilysin family protein [Acidipropionibacterium timonense]